MDIKKLVALLKVYADHKDYCSITNALNNSTEAGMAREYPECSCGWVIVNREVDKFLRGE